MRRHVPILLLAIARLIQIVLGLSNVRLPSCDKSEIYGLCGSRCTCADVANSDIRKCQWMCHVFFQPSCFCPEGHAYKEQSDGSRTCVKWHMCEHKRRKKEEMPPLCFEISDPGEYCMGNFGSESVWLWYHHRKFHACHEIFFRGCNGKSMNLFSTREICEDTCIWNRNQNENRGIDMVIPHNFAGSDSDGFDSDGFLEFNRRRLPAAPISVNNGFAKPELNQPNAEPIQSKSTLSTIIEDENPPQGDAGKSVASVEPLPQSKINHIPMISTTKTFTTIRPKRITPSNRKLEPDQIESTDRINETRIGMIPVETESTDFESDWIGEHYQKRANHPRTIEDVKHETISRISPTSGWAKSRSQFELEVAGLHLFPEIIRKFKSKK